MKLLFKLGARLASIPDATIFTSYRAQQWHESLGFKPARWQYVPAGVDTNIFRPDSHLRTSLRSELSLPPDVPIVGTVGRFHAQKDYPTFLRAFAELCRVVPIAHAVMVGANVTPANRELAELARHLGIGDKVHMLGLRSDIQSILAGFDLFALASAFGELCPTVLIEAMACGVPCVATDVGDSARIVGDTGKIVSARNPTALAAAGAEVLANRGASSSAAARQRIQECYSLKIMAKGFADLFEDLVSRRSGVEVSHFSMERAESAIEHNPPAAASNINATATRIRHSIKHALYGSAVELPRIVGITAMRQLPSRVNSLRVLAYHKVSDQRPNIIAVGTSLFRQQQEYLAEHYRVISPDEFADHLELGTPLPDKAVLLTFDDTNSQCGSYSAMASHQGAAFRPVDEVRVRFPLLSGSRWNGRRAVRLSEVMLGLCDFGALDQWRRRLGSPALLVDRAFLKWRFLDHPIHRYEIFGWLDGYRLLGYYVRRRFRIPLVWLAVDWQGEDLWRDGPPGAWLSPTLVPWPSALSAHVDRPRMLFKPRGLDRQFQFFATPADERCADNEPWSYITLAASDIG